MADTVQGLRPRLTTRQLAEAGTLIGLAAISAVAVVVSIGYGLWRDGFSGAGLYPCIVAGIAAVAAVAEALRTLLTAPPADDPSFIVEGDEPAEIPEYAMTGLDWRRLSLYALGIIAIGVFFKPLGFLAALGLGLIVIIWLAERQSILRACVITALLLVTIHILFVVLLQMQLPPAALFS